jgi:glycosyltransferase involved in cell wall biosynthesis
VVIAFDCAHERQSDAGVTRAARSLAEALEKRSDISLVRLGEGPLVPRGTLRKKLLTIEQDSWWYPVRGRQLARRANADIYHCPATRAPVTRGRVPLVVTIHDLASFRFPATLTAWMRLYDRTMLPRSAAAADRIIAPSNDSADDIATILRIRDDKIRIVPHGIDQSFFEEPRSARRYDFPYVLFVGTPQPRKNLERLSEAVRSLTEGGHDLRLVVAGTGGWGGVSLTGSHLEVAGNVSDDELRSLYRHAECVALVSLHEGFGFPALEAMACGTPLVAGNVAALPELVGDAATLVDPLSVTSIADGILDAIARKDDLVRAGRIRARGYSWEIAASRTVDVYRELL